VFLDISCNGSRVPVELTTSGGKRRIVLGGRELDCDWLAIAEGKYSIILDGRVFDLSVEVDGQSCFISTGGNTYELQLLDRRRLRSEKSVETGKAGLQRVTAAMPGKVVRILVSEGETVEHAQGLLVLEAMKMQNEIRAPKSGVVKQIGVSEGRAVNTGEFLVSLE
jgi:acetyl/propionyl-CoA carboxylase alpha subunit